MSGPDPQWKILRCPQCDGLMKIDRQNIPESLACPSCGTLFGDEFGDLSEVEGLVGQGDEVIRGGDEAESPADGGGPGPVATANPEEIALDSEIGAMPEIVSPAVLEEEGVAIPERRRDDYKMPEMISNIGEKPRAPATEEPTAPKIDASRLASTDDEDLAADEKEEGALQVHVARKIAGWDLDESGGEEDSAAAEASRLLRRKLAMVAIGLVSVLFLGLIVYGVVQSMREKEVVVREEEKDQTEIAREAMTELERDALDRSDEIFAAAGEVLEKFLSAPSHRERLKFVRDAGRVGPLMEAYYQAHPDGPISFRVPEEGWRMQPFETFLLATVESEEYSYTAVALERGEDGEFLVDWESFVGYCEIPWGKIMEEKRSEPFLVRARVALGDYFNYGYTEAEWICLTMQDTSGEHTLYGYLHRKDPLISDLGKVLPRQGVAHLTLMIAHPGEKKAKNQFLIKEIIEKGWVLSGH